MRISDWSSDVCSSDLLRFELDAGELGKRQIFSGIRASYGEPEKLVGRNVVFIANLAPRKMRFGMSEGMILSAGLDAGQLALLAVDGGAPPGMPVRELPTALRCPADAHLIGHGPPYNPEPPTTPPPPP